MFTLTIVYGLLFVISILGWDWLISGIKSGKYDSSEVCKNSPLKKNNSSLAIVILLLAGFWPITLLAVLAVYVASLIFGEEKVVNTIRKN